MIKKIFYVIFLFISTSVYSIAQEVADNITINKNHIYSLDRDTEKIHPEYRAMLFSKTLENILNDPQEKSISIEYMTSLQKKANKSMKNGQYEQAYRYYYEAALYYPKVLLFFSDAQDIYEKYKKDENNIEISKNEILYCK